MYRIYYAGDLFDVKHITGNKMLANQIEKISGRRYQCILPQDWEGELNNAIDIRNKDIKSVMQADAVLFNFDGVDLDSGTVIEFMIAKMLDIPAVLLRTDVRNKGYLFGDDWNLMALGYPRCVTIKHPSLMMYNDLGLEKMHTTIATSIVDAFDNLLSEPSILSSYHEIMTAYQHVIKVCGSGLDQEVSAHLLHAIITAKIEKEVYAVSVDAEQKQYGIIGTNTME